MAEKRRFLDVWIVESNSVYKEVPFTVVTDWTQQGRLLEDDMLRPSGTEKWFRLGNTPALVAYLPREDPYRTDDQAEALGAVEVDFSWKRPRADEDDDVDMIPLIDISLVLLIFFMMTTTVAVAGAASWINVPDTEHGSALASPGMIWIGIDRKPDGQPSYSFGEGEKGAEPENQNLTETQLFERLTARIKTLPEPVEIRITAHRQLPYEVVKNMTIALEPYRQRGQIKKVFAEVSEKGP